MDFLNFPADQFKIFLMIFLRTTIVMHLFPIFGSQMLPAQIKIGLSLLFTLALFSFIQIDPGLFPENIIDVVIIVVSEIMIGMVMGLTIRIYFAGIQLAGRLIGFQMGFGIINVIDPQTGAQVSIIEQIGYWIVLMIFILLNGHHTFLAALAHSFNIIDIGSIVLKKQLFSQMLFLSKQMFVMAIKIGAPAIVALLFTSVAFGLCAKFVPQMNILIAAFPVKIVVGLIFLGISIQAIAYFTNIYMGEFKGLLIALLRALSP